MGTKHGAAASGGSKRVGESVGRCIEGRCEVGRGGREGRGVSKGQSVGPFISMLTLGAIRDFQSTGFFDLKVVRGREIRRLKAEIAYFQKIKFLGPIEYSNMAEYASKVHYGGRKLPREPCGNLWEK